MSVAPGNGCYIPLAHKGSNDQGSLNLGDDSKDDDRAANGLLPDQIALDNAIEILKPMLEDPAVLKVGHNIKYDTLLLSRYGIAINPVDDTILISFVLDGGRNRHGMDELAKLHLDHNCISFKDVAGTGKNLAVAEEMFLEWPAGATVLRVRGRAQLGDQVQLHLGPAGLLRVVLRLPSVGIGRADASTAFSAS